MAIQYLPSHSVFFLRGYKAFILEKGLLRCLKLLPGTELKGLVHQCDCIVSGQSVHASHGSRFHYKAHGSHRSTPFTRRATNEIDDDHPPPPPKKKKQKKKTKKEKKTKQQQQKRKATTSSAKFLVPGLTSQLSFATDLFFWAVN